MYIVSRQLVEPDSYSTICGLSSMSVYTHFIQEPHVMSWKRRMNSRGELVVIFSKQHSHVFDDFVRYTLEHGNVLREVRSSMPVHVCLEQFYFVLYRTISCHTFI